MCINAHKASTIDQFESILCSRFAFQLFFCLDFNTKNCYQHKVDVLLQLLLLECELYCLMSSSKIVIPLFKIKKIYRPESCKATNQWFASKTNP